VSLYEYRHANVKFTVISINSFTRVAPYFIHRGTKLCISCWTNASFTLTATLAGLYNHRIESV